MTAKQKITDEEALERLENLDPNDRDVTVWDRAELRELEEAVAARRTAADRVDTLVVAHRNAGVTWTALAAVLGVSHQAVMKRYRDHVLR